MLIHPSNFARGALCACLVAGVSLWADAPPNAPTQTAGHVEGMVPLAFRNANPAQPKELVNWNDLLRTEEKGRMRVTLLDGSLLSLGSKAQLRVLVHNPQSQETALELTYGELRSRVKRLTQPRSVFMIKTPQATLGVLGTDFYVLVRPKLTEVLCFSGAVYIASPDGRPMMILPGGKMTRIERSRPGPMREIPEDRGRHGHERTRLDEKEVENDHVLHAELEKSVDSKNAKAGDEVEARTTREAQVDDKTKLPKNTTLVGRVVESEARAKKDAASRLAVVFEKAILRGGEEIVLRASIQAVRAPASHARISDAFGPRSQLATARGGRAGGLSSGGGGGGAVSGGGTSGSGGGGSDDNGGSSGGSGSSGSGSSGSGSSGSDDSLTSGSSGSGSSGSDDDGVEDRSGSDSGSDDSRGSYGEFEAQVEASEDHLGAYSVGTRGMADTILQRASVEGGVALVSTGASVKIERGSELVLRLPE